MTTLLAFVGRLLIALLFIVSGVNKLFDVAGTQAMLSSVGLPSALAIPTGLFELIAGLALVFGVLTRLFAVLLALFCLVAAFFFHNDFLDPTQATMLLKNIAIAGGLLCLTALDTARWSYDAMRARRRAELEAHQAELRAHDAEVRAARAEGVTAATRSREVEGSALAGRTVVADADGDGIPDVRERPPT
jgi:putative oxidoreductase